MVPEIGTRRAQAIKRSGPDYGRTSNAISLSKIGFREAAAPTTFRQRPVCYPPPWVAKSTMLTRQLLHCQPDDRDDPLRTVGFEGEPPQVSIYCAWAPAIRHAA
jgi:hypothetical protein